MTRSKTVGKPESMYRKLLTPALLYVTLPALAADGGPMKETWWINSAKTDCVGVAPMTCFEVQRSPTLDPEGWELFYSHIEGFEYEPGYLYQVIVEVRDRPPPLPADVSAKTYALVEILSQAADPALRLTNLWKVVSVGDIREPRNAKGQPLVFEFNASMRTYAGDLGCNRIRGALTQNDGRQLKLGAGMATLMSCADMSVEDAVSTALTTTRSYDLRNGVLRFLDEDGAELMTFSPGD